MKTKPCQFSFLGVVLFFFSSLLLLSSCQKKREGKPRILVFSKAADFYHTSIPTGVAALQKLAQQNNIDVDTTTDAAYFHADSLKRYAAVVFLNTTGNVLNQYQEVAFERYIQSGGGFVGIHSATDTEYDWGWYGRLVGAYFEGHPKVQPAVLRVVDNTHPATKDLPKEWKRTDEWYNFKKLNKDVKVLLTIDEKTYEGGKNGDHHPMSWYHEYDGGRAFYTELGHTDETFAEPLYLKHLLGGIQYAIGDNSELDYDNAKSREVPEEDRFVKTTLTQGTLFEPTEMAVLPSFDVLIAQRRGEIMRYSEKDKTVKQVGFLNVYHQSGVEGVNAEEGVMGMATDPDFKSNNYVYIFYSPIDTSVNRLSRFEYKNDTIDTRSEKVVLQFYSQRAICCHTGGSIAFGKDNLLYLSTGDNATPFDEKGQRFVNNGFAPLNDAPGHEQYDARRTSGNTNDLRGKIIRIRIKADGSYEIPEGNLFVNTPKAKPEIYVMGNRNPYRISVDKKTGFLYWGEVGPDSNVDSFDTRGPRGYDEVNQAREAGFFGWPLFVGNNHAYREFDYTTGASGEVFAVAKPVNRSRNNTGLQELPPAKPAFIWYPYDASVQFPQLGTGGRNAMAGPVYYSDNFPKDSRLPDYYDGKLFIYDWIRGWVRAVTMLPNGDLDRIEPFMEHTKFAAPIDMEAGPDGRLYVLEYGSGWFSKNPDAGLSRIDYLAGNRPPKVANLSIDKTSGSLPYTFTATVEATDPEKDDLTYTWLIGGEKKETKEPRITHTINKAGDYVISVQVQDEQKAFATSNTVEVYAGNEQPQLKISLQGNQSFYFPGKPVEYKVDVADKEGTVNPANLFVSTDYIRGFDRAEQSMGHQVITGTIAGKNLVQSSDCKTCHKLDEKSIGPSFTQVAQRYSGKTDSSAFLAQKIIKGGAGNWGETAMPAHPTMKETDASQMVQWILSLSATANKSKSLPPMGRVMPAPDLKGRKSTLSLQATYTDEGGAGGIKPLSNSAVVYLRSNNIIASDITEMAGFSRRDSAGTRYYTYPSNTGWLKIPQVDLASIRGIEIVNSSSSVIENGRIEVRTGSASGSVIGAVEVKGTRGNVTVPLQGSFGQGFVDVYILFRNTGGGSKPLFASVRFLQ